MIKLVVISPKDYQKLLKNKFVISYGLEKSPFGMSLIGLHGTAICHLSFVDVSKFKNLDVLKQQWPGAIFIFDKNMFDIAQKIFYGGTQTFEVFLKGTPFEAKVWHELLNIPEGKTVSYQDVAAKIGHEKAVRAVASAVAKNPVSYLVPCHRVIRKDGKLHKYQWGSEIKKKILKSEKCYFENEKILIKN